MKGIKFRQSSKIEVRFGDGKTAATVPGEFVDRTTVKCKTPNFETFGAIEVDVKVAISGEGWNKIDEKDRPVIEKKVEGSKT